MHAPAHLHAWQNPFVKHPAVTRVPDRTFAAALTLYTGNLAHHYLMGAVQLGQWLQRRKMPFVVFIAGHKDSVPPDWVHMLASHCIPMVELGNTINISSAAVARKRWETAFSKLLIFNHTEFGRIVLIDPDHVFWTNSTRTTPLSIDRAFDICPSPKFCAVYSRAADFYDGDTLRLARNRMFNSGVLVFSPNVTVGTWLMDNLENRTGLLTASDLSAADQTLLWRFLTPGHTGRTGTDWWELPYQWNTACASEGAERPMLAVDPSRTDPTRCQQNARVAAVACQAVDEEASCPLLALAPSLGTDAHRRTAMRTRWL